MPLMLVPLWNLHHMLVGGVTSGLYGQAFRGITNHQPIHVSVTRLRDESCPQERERERDILIRMRP